LPCPSCANASQTQWHRLSLSIQRRFATPDDEFNHPRASLRSENNLLSNLQPRDKIFEHPKRIFEIDISLLTFSIAE
jgi:hypothetical protein